MHLVLICHIFLFSRYFVWICGQMVQLCPGPRGYFCLAWRAQLVPVVLQPDSGFINFWHIPDVWTLGFNHSYTAPTFSPWWSHKTTGNWRIYGERRHKEGEREQTTIMWKVDRRNIWVSEQFHLHWGGERNKPKGNVLTHADIKEEAGGQRQMLTNTELSATAVSNYSLAPTSQIKHSHPALWGLHKRLHLSLSLSGTVRALIHMIL